MEVFALFGLCGDYVLNILLCNSVEILRKEQKRIAEHYAEKFGDHCRMEVHSLGLQPDTLHNAYVSFRVIRGSVKDIACYCDVETLLALPNLKQIIHSVRKIAVHAYKYIGFTVDNLLTGNLPHSAPTDEFMRWKALVDIHLRIPLALRSLESLFIAKGVLLDNDWGIDENIDAKGLIHETIGFYTYLCRDSLGFLAPGKYREDIQPGLLLRTRKVIKTAEELVGSDDPYRQQKLSSTIKHIDAILDDFRISEMCGKCGSPRYLSDLPQYNNVCYDCDENF